LPGVRTGGILRGVSQMSHIRSVHDDIAPEPLTRRTRN
jgi:hypothetical protein